ncbi:hypothetical protein [Bacillus sinesaloumensis]|uniref:hypothetical protein n=1 Tax=Litchfieldia sinesaloumensis TaxID=1926280 RepID=UPI000988546E|nr:hypothetical protein [Bacillus sinesaloumensis]
MNMHKLILTGFLVSGILAGCSQDETTIDSEKYVESIEDDSKGWIDAAPEVKEFLAALLDEVEKTPSGKYEQGYEQYLLAEKLTKGLGVGDYQLFENDNLDKDFANLLLIAKIISHEQFVRTSHIDGNGGAIDRIDLSDQWKPIQDSQLMAFDYMKQLLNDLNVILNNGGEGSTFGVTYYQDGENVAKMEQDLQIGKVD